MSSKQAEGSTLSELTIVHPELEFPRVSLEEPTSSFYVHLAAEVDRPVAPFLPVFLFDSEKKRRLIATCKELCQQLRMQEWVLEAPVFKATIIPPGRGEYLEKTDEAVHIARFDVAVLIEIADIEALGLLRENEAYRQLEEIIREVSSHHHIVSATNIKRIGPVDHETEGVFYSIISSPKTQSRISQSGNIRLDGSNRKRGSTIQRCSFPTIQSNRSTL